MTITQDTATLIETLARAASQIGSTAASAKINKVIVDLLPTPAEDESIAEALRQDNAELQISGRIMAENMELLRGKLGELKSIMKKTLPPNLEPISNDDLQRIYLIADLTDSLEE